MWDVWCDSCGPGYVVTGVAEEWVAVDIYRQHWNLGHEGIYVGVEGEGL